MEQIQAKSLEMAEYFVEFCNEHNLLCYLCGGGAIGSLRHGGFIPWDDGEPGRSRLGDRRELRV